ncbi:methyltransferase domain-containing protein [Candidatus Viadribacter manganicus]|uniref:Methyltransferase domain-containing protein n=1 Tax=Candidatus Viadribacter manganicus TaxID=1759059 RepID=A0A1B1ADF8_9PROT|nr:class I SAM-dependent methyltransferase [Candidatus Viadribacter manganicus]ANP44591.1 hypothetical protein ATE48_00940 [Candidatus Viadribacter manganicus]
MSATPYNSGFYDRQSDGSRRSADAVVPLLLEWFSPKSVLDIGCGVGTWCAAFEHAGVPLVAGLDGPWVDRAQLQMQPNGFVTFDFANAPKPYKPALPVERFDLVVTFEVLEHIDPIHAADAVQMITGLTDIVVAGAAIPGQGGRHHVNEQWPSYWSELFASRGFEAFDCVRPVVAHLEGLDPWYAQNAVLYARSPIGVELKARLDAAVIAALSKPAPWVHPALYQGVKRKLARHARPVSSRLAEWRAKAERK